LCEFFLSLMGRNKNIHHDMYINFLDSATPIYERIIEIHHHVFFFLIIVLFFVS
jgi:protein tyrosine phosphatase